MTVSETLKILEQANIVVRKTGLVMLSPKIAHKGNARKERYLMTKFEKIQGVQFVDFTDGTMKQKKLHKKSPRSCGCNVFLACDVLDNIFNCTFRECRAEVN